MTLPTIEVQIDHNGVLHAIEPQARVPAGRALLTLLDPAPLEAALLAQPALMDDWLQPQEDDAWAHLQPGA